MRRGIDLFGHQHSPDGILQNLTFRFRRYPTVIGDVVQVRDEDPNIRVARLPEGLLDGESARRSGRLSVADPLQLAHLRGMAQEPFYQGPEVPAHQSPKVPEHACPVEDCDDCLSKKRSSKSASHVILYVSSRLSSHLDDPFSSRYVNSIIQIIPIETPITSPTLRPNALSLFFSSASPHSPPNSERAGSIIYINNLHCALDVIYICIGCFPAM